MMFKALIIICVFLLLVPKDINSYCHREQPTYEQIDKMKDRGCCDGCGYRTYDHCHPDQRYETKLIKNAVTTCHNVSVENINHEMSNAAKELIVQESYIPVLSPISSATTWNVSKLDLSNNSISKILPGYFNHMHSLTELRLQENNLTKVIDGVFSSLGSLKVLNLSRNHIQSLSNHCFTGVIELNILDLSKNNISFLPDGIFEYETKLQDINLSFNHIKNIGKLFTGSTVKNISFKHNMLTHVDFNDLPMCLENLDLSDNQIGSLNNFYNYSSSNANLTKLLVSNNKITILPKTANIVWFNASSNHITRIQDNILSPDLLMLDMSYNLISEISETSFANLTKLLFLYLQHNNLSSLPVSSFKDLTSLQNLNLSQNRLIHLEYGLFSTLQFLSALDISGNSLDFDIQSLSTLTSLRDIRLANNHVKTIDVQAMVKHFPNLKNVSLDGNFWTCKDLADIVHTFEYENITVVKGIHYNQNNVLGIGCTISNQNKENREKPNPKVDVHYEDLSDNSFIKYLDDNFKNTNFYKYMEGLKLKFSQTNYDQNVTTRENITQSFTAKYFDSDFKKSNFYKYLESLDQPKTENTTRVLQTFLAKYLDKDFKSTNFFKYLESLKNPQIIIKQINDLNSTGLKENMIDKSTLIKYSTASLTDSLSNYLNNDFKNTSFYKLLETFREKISDNDHEIKTAKLEAPVAKDVSNNSVNLSGLFSCILLLCMMCILMYLVLIVKKVMLSMNKDKVELSTLNLLSNNGQ